MRENIQTEKKRKRKMFNTMSLSNEERKILVKNARKKINK